MNRRDFLTRLGAAAAGAALPLQYLAARGGDVAREIARFSQGTLRFIPSRTGFDPVGFHGGDSLGWIEDAKGIAFAWVDKAQRIHWPDGEITRVFQR